MSSNASAAAIIPATQPVLPDGPDSQSVPITWDLHETIHGASQPASGGTTTQSADEPVSPPVYRVVFSTMDQEQREHCTAVVEQLGGTVLNPTHYDPMLTHIVVSRMGSNEKLLTSVAAGKWVLHPDWLVDSGQAGRFLNEADYEWGNPAAILDLKQLTDSEDEARIARAAHYWRTCRTRSSSQSLSASSRPFSGIKAVLNLRDKNDSFRRLLEAGGGQVVDSE